MDKEKRAIEERKEELIEEIEGNFDFGIRDAID